jgi:hypothetical protein
LLVENIESYLAGSFWTLKSDIVLDSIQKCRLALVCVASDESHLVELVEPSSQDSPVYPALVKGLRQHHICFELSTCHEADAFIKANRLLPVTKWVGAELFQGRLIRFAYTRHHELLEFLTDEHD